MEREREERVNRMEGEEKNAFTEWRERERKYLEYLDFVTNNPLQEEENILAHILEKNANTEYLKKFKLDGAIDVVSFRDRVPVSDYETYLPYIDRIYEGDKSPLITSDPIVEFLISSGTSGGNPRLTPITAEDLELRGIVWNMMRPVLNRELPGLEKGKVLFFYFQRTTTMSPGGVPCHSAVTSFIRSSCFKQRPFDPSYILTSPDEVIECIDNDVALYCHLLLGLLQCEEVVRFGAIFAPVIIKAMKVLEELHHEICEDIASGTLNPSRVQDETVRSAVIPLLRKDPKLAEFIRKEFSSPDPAIRSCSDGRIRRLWPNVKVLDTVCTGSLETYIPALSRYSDNLPIICTQLYAATEGYFGINLHPMTSPDKICYTLFPPSAYYEFIALSDSKQKNSDAAHDDILDLMSLHVGQEYEVLVTTVSGFYRYRMGDVLKVVGFYNKTPIFEFVRRMNTILSIDSDKTDDKELHIAVCTAVELLEKRLGLRLVEYTSTTDLTSQPGHYVVFFEVVSSSRTDTIYDECVLQQACSAMEASLNFIYRRGRHEKLIGAIELRLVQEGTFDLLAEHAISKGATLSQYKPPRGLHPVKSAALLEILNSKVTQKVFSQEKPPFAPEAFRARLNVRQGLRESPSSRRMVLQSTGELKARD